MSESPLGLVVRSATAADLDLFAALETRAFDDPWTREDMEPLFDAGAAEAFLVEDERGDAVAYALFQLLPGEVELLTIGVVPEIRSRGVGRLLLSTALDRLAASGRPVCHLEVRVGNAAARVLYERLGFELVGLRRAYYADGEDAARLVRAPKSKAVVV